jgi:hypothetical protein
LEKAGQIYGGDLLAGLALDEPPFEEWLLTERLRLRELTVDALARLLAHQRGAGADEAAIQTGRRLLALDPLQEPVHRAVMRLYARQGRRGAALRQYQACVAVLQRELRVEPEAETQALYQEILRQPSPGTGPAGASAAAGSDADSPPPLTSPVPTATTPDPAATAVLTWTDVLPCDGPLIGRAAEMSRLRGAMERVNRGRGEIVAILGEAGVGKSRTASELATETSSRGWRVLVGRACEAERILPFAPWVDALRASGVTHDDVTRELAPVWRAGLRCLLPEMVEPMPATDSDDRLLVFQSVAEALTALAARQPILLVLEDLHWADEASLSLLGFVGRRLLRTRILALITAREEDVHAAARLSEILGDLDRHGRLEQLTLPPLSRGASLALVRVLAPELRAQSGEAMAERVWAESQGNPFVLIETLRVIRDRPNGQDTAPPGSPRGSGTRSPVD